MWHASGMAGENNVTRAGSPLAPTHTQGEASPA
jgi:hypothetical protein